MEILEMKSTITEMKNSLEGLNRFELTRKKKKRLLNLGTSQENKSITQPLKRIHLNQF